MGGSVNEFEFWLIKERDDKGNPVKVEVLAPEDVVVVRNEDGEIAGYLHSRRIPEDATQPP